MVIKVLVAVKVPEVDVRDVIQAHRRHLVETTQTFTWLKAESRPDDVGLALVIDAELFRLEGTVRWLDAADSRLGQLDPAPVSVEEPRPAPHDAEVRQ